MLHQSMKLLRIVIPAAALLLAGLYFVFDPGSSAWSLKCPFRMLTGLDCPACGNQRALHALLHGEWLAAWSFNPFALLSLPYIAAVIYASLADNSFARRLRPMVQHRRVVCAYLILVVLWWIVRNTPLWHGLRMQME